MSRNIPIPHQKVEKLYKTLFSNSTISNKKGNIRMMTESIINYLLWKYEHIDIDKENLKRNKIDFSERIDKLKKRSIIPIIHVPAYFFLYNEGNLGSHSSNNSDDAGEDTYVESAIILLKPIIKKFFDEEDLESDFLNDFNQKNNDASPSIINNTHLESVNSEKLFYKIEKEKKLLIYVFACVLLLLVTFSTFFIKSLYSDLDASQEKIDEYLKINSSQNELIKRKQAKIDSLNLIINTSQQKSNINNGIQNEFKGKVDNVTNVGKVDKLEI